MCVSLDRTSLRISHPTSLEQYISYSRQDNLLASFLLLSNTSHFLLAPNWLSDPMNSILLQCSDFRIASPLT